MLNAVETERGHAERRLIRRAVSLDCEVLSDQWDGSAFLRAKNLSPLGLWVDTPLPLEVGGEVLVSLTPPAWPRPAPLVALANVARVSMPRRRFDFADTGMGLEFTDIESRDSSLLTEVLRGLPPPIPRRRPVSIHRFAPPVPPTWCLADRDESLLILPDGTEVRFLAEARLLTGNRPIPAPRLYAPRRSITRARPYLSMRALHPCALS